MLMLFTCISTFLSYNICQVIYFFHEIFSASKKKYLLLFLVVSDIHFVTFTICSAQIVFVILCHDILLFGNGQHLVGSPSD